MILARKLLVPTIIIFTAILLALLGVYAFNSLLSLQAEEQKLLTRLEQLFETRLQDMGTSTLSLASEAATNPAIQEAFANRDRQGLIELALPSFKGLNDKYNIDQYQYHLPNAVSFLRLHQLDTYGDDLTSSRLTVVAANSEKRPISGLEAGRGGMGIRGVVPVYYKGEHIGSVETGIELNKNQLAKLEAESGTDWQIFLRKETAAAIENDAGSQTPGPVPGLLLEYTTLDAPFYSGVDAYQKADQGTGSITHIRQGGRSYAVYTFPLRNYGGDIVGVVDIIADRTASLATLLQQVLAALLLIIVAIIVVTFALLFITRRTLEPVNTLKTNAAMIAAGNLNLTIPVESKDELGDLARTLNAMTSQLRELVSQMEQRVSERTLLLERRTVQMQAAAEVARDITSTRNLDELLIQAVNLIRDRFRFYHAGIFLVDERGEYAYLQAATGEAGRQMLQRRHRLKVGEEGLVGYATGKGLPRVALDVGADAVHFKNPLLPDTRSELALPLKVGEQVIGALDVQSTAEAAFDDEDIAVLQTMADQLAMAIDRTRLISRMETALRETGEIYQRQVRQAWANLNTGLVALQQPSITAFEYDRLQVKPAGEHPSQLMRLTPELRAELEAGNPVFSSAEKTGHTTLVVPIRLRNEIIGIIAVDEEDPERTWSQDEITIAQAAANQAALTLENARLLLETQRRATREQVIGDVTSRMRESLDIDMVLKTAVQQVRQALGLPEITVRLASPEKKPNGKRPEQPNPA